MLRLQLLLLSWRESSIHLVVRSAGPFLRFTNLHMLPLSASATAELWPVSDPSTCFGNTVGECALDDAS